MQTDRNFKFPAVYTSIHQISARISRILRPSLSCNSVRSVAPSAYPNSLLAGFVGWRRCATLVRLSGLLLPKED